MPFANRTDLVAGEAGAGGEDGGDGIEAGRGVGAGGGEGLAQVAGDMGTVEVGAGDGGVDEGAREALLGQDEDASTVSIPGDEIDDRVGALDQLKLLASLAVLVEREPKKLRRLGGDGGGLE